MAAQAKYLFDQDFAAGRSPAEKPIAPAEHAIKLGEAESKGFRDGFAAAEKEGTAVAARRTAVAFEQIGDALDRLARGACRGRAAARNRSRRACGRGRPQACARARVARAVRRDRGARDRMLQAAHRGAARRGARQRRAARDRPRRSSTTSPAPAASRAASWWSPSPRSRPATARSNGPTAASSATPAKTDLAIGNAIGRYLGARQTAAMPELGEIEPGESRHE